jgi:thioester reductase-like protein
LSLPVRLLRVGQLSGSTITGQWNISEAWPIMFATAEKLNAIPLLPNTSVDWIPVDIAAQVITDILSHEFQDLYTTHNIVNPHPITWDTFITLLQKAMRQHGNYMREVSMSEWVGSLQRIQEMGHESEEIVGLKLLEFFQSMIDDDTSGKKFNTSNTEEVSAALRNCSVMSQQLVETYVSSWKQSQFL